MYVPGETLGDCLLKSLFQFSSLEHIKRKRRMSFGIPYPGYNWKRIRSIFFFFSFFFFFFFFFFVFFFFFFFVFFFVMKNNCILQVLTWKFCHLLHKLVRDGHRKVVDDSFRYAPRLGQLANFWQHLSNSGYGSANQCYCKLLSNRLQFHKRVSLFIFSILIFS